MDQKSRDDYKKTLDWHHRLEWYERENNQKKIILLQNCHCTQTFKWFLSKIKCCTFHDLKSSDLFEKKYVVNVNGAGTHGIFA